MNQPHHSPKSLTRLLMSSSQLFARLNPDELETFASQLELVQVNGGDILIRQGDTADCMYSVISGRLRVYTTDDDGKMTIVGEIAGGESVGEMAMITGGQRSANVQAIRDTELIRLTREGFENLVTRHPRVMLKMAGEIVSRMQHLLSGPEKVTPVKTITLVPLDENVPLVPFANRLAHELEIQGPVLFLDRERFERAHGEGACEWESDTSVESRALASWLSHQETTHRMVLYVADPILSAWTRRCLRGADRIVLVGRSGASPDPGEIEQFLWGSGRDHSPVELNLVLLHSAAERIPNATRDWLEKRQAIQHFHVNMERDEDYARLGRFLAREAVGLVLGGGGARGFAHIGVIRALEEAGVPIDAVCGVSMGAILAAQYAMGHDTEDMLRMNKAGIIANNLPRDFTLPLIAMTSGKKFRKVLQQYYGETRIEDLWLNYFCVSCNLSTAATVVHRKGALTRAVAASNAAPGVLPPVPEDGNLLVDGGIVNNQPGDIMKRLCGGPVIVVNASPVTALTVDERYRELPSAWRVLGSRISPFRNPINMPTITTMLMQTLMVGSHRKAQEVERHADYYLRPPLSKFHLTDYARIDEIAEAGYRYTMEQIAAWSVLPGVKHDRLQS
jgi:NTE family protein/lysophospholipid hydrolase